MLDSHTVADEIRRSVTEADALRDVVDRGAASFEGILEGIRGTADSVGEISRLTGQQKSAAAEVTRALERISSIATRNARGTEEATSATDEQTLSTQKMAESARALAGTSDHLRDLIAIFKLH